MRRTLAVAVLALAAVLVSSSAVANPRPPDWPHRSQSHASSTPRARAGDVRVGQLVLHPCDVVARALCGSIPRPWEPAQPSNGTVTVGFAFVPAADTSRPPLGTVVPHEGGPGYSTTGTGADYAQMYGPLLARRNLLLVDQRGTGLSEPIDCPDLQNLVLAYRVAAERCGRSLGDRAADYTSALSSDDLAAVISALRLGRVDLYGDSYGTFFAQVFAGRHGDLLRSLVLDSAYPTYGESGFYPTQGPAMRHAFDAVCRRSAPCRTQGRPFLPTLRKVLRAVRRHPWRGVAHDADGRRAKVEVSGSTLTSLMFGATFSPAWSRETTAALRAGLHGDRAPLLRLVAEALGGGTDAGDPADYSEGLDAAVACHDYPQLYDMTAPPELRERQYDAALADRTRWHPSTYAPFTVREYADSDWQSLDWCTRWPVAPADNPAGPPAPVHGYPRVPVLVLSGDLDSITTTAEGRLAVEQFPRAQLVRIRNSFHVTAVDDHDRCGSRLVRAFVASPAPLSSRRTSCARRVPPVRAPGRFARSLTQVLPAAADRSVSLSTRRRVAAAVATVADVQDRWWNSYSGKGAGLRGGTWTFTDSGATGGTTTFVLHRVALVRDVRVSGTARWNRDTSRMRVALRLGGRRLSGSWNTRRPGARASLVGWSVPRRTRFTLPAP